MKNLYIVLRCKKHPEHYQFSSPGWSIYCKCSKCNEDMDNPTAHFDRFYVKGPLKYADDAELLDALVNKVKAGRYSLELDRPVKLKGLK